VSYDSELGIHRFSHFDLRSDGAGRLGSEFSTTDQGGGKRGKGLFRTSL
jgi:hypothetical protein